MNAGGGSGRVRPWRLTVWLALALFAYWGFLATHTQVRWALGVNDFGVWFLDLFALLASNDAVARGLDPSLPNPLDYLHRPHVYSHWWLRLRDLGLTRADVHWLGPALGGAFLAAAFARLRPREPRQMLFYLAVLACSPVLLAVNRANNDLVVFLLLTPLVSCLLDARPAVRLAAPALVALAAALKYYPAAAGLVLLAPAPVRELRWRIGVFAALLGVVALDLASDLTAFLSLAPRPDGLMSFGATAIFEGLGWTGWAPKLTALAAGAAAFGWFWRSRPLGAWEPAAEQRADWLHLVLGASLLTGCFFASANFAYRWIFAIWLAPLLWALPGDATMPPAGRWLARAMRALLVAVLWIDVLGCVALNAGLGAVPLEAINRWAARIFLAGQPVVWAFFLCALAFLAHFARGGARALGGTNQAAAPRGR